MNRQQTLDAASAAVGERPKSYGSPEDNFARIADLWSTYLAGKIPGTDPKQPVNATDVAAMMVLMKVARIMATPGHDDSWIDIAGYAACGAEVSTRPGIPESVVELIDRALAQRPRAVPEDAQAFRDGVWEDGKRV